MELTVSRGAVGTPAYMAPEQARDPHQGSVASDVYSLGATLLFAATGHPPYQGASVMDVLARLATEPPDLSGLPAELTGLVTACLERVPRARPTSAAILAQLGQFTESQVSSDQEHAYLPEPAMALIGEYQRNPQLGVDSGGGEHGDETTDASFTELPAGYKVRSRRKPGFSGRARAPPEQSAGPGWWRWLTAHLAWAGWVSVGAALVVGGVILGASLTSSGSTTPAPPPAPLTGCAAAADNGAPGHGAALCMAQVSGDAGTAFVVRGSGFAPQTPVTVTVTGLSPPPASTKIMDSTSPVRPVTAKNGTISVNVSQLFPASFPLGLFTVEVTGADGAHASTQFRVIPPSAPPN
jgi:hypothetical protein